MAVETKEKRKLSPVLLIIPLIAGATLLLGKKKEPEPPPGVWELLDMGTVTLWPELPAAWEVLHTVSLPVSVYTAEAADFVYASDLIVEPWGGPNDIRWTVKVTNVGDSPGVLHLDVYERMQIPRGIQWSGFSLRDSQEVEIAPGETYTFTGTKARGSYTYQLMAKSEAGTLLNPKSPLEFICGCCLDMYEQTVSFATEEELDAHYASAHPEYAPMEPCRSFTVRGLSWPDAFYHEYWVNPERELYGRIAKWKAEIFVGRPAPVEPIDDQEFDLSGMQSDWVTPDQAIQFIMPEGWISSGRGLCGVIPNTTVMKLYFQTDLGWSGWLDYSPWLQRIPDGAEITFICDSMRTTNWTIVPPVQQLVVTAERLR